jgi:hypothetical protein
MKLKDGVVLAGLDTRMRPALIVCEDTYKDFGEELVITSGLEGCHSAGSLHYYGLAIDIRTRMFTLERKRDLADELQRRLGWAFTVVLESSHIHIEYDMRE